MNQNTYPVIGLMSGTSGDGLDLAYCEFTFDAQWSFKLINAKTVPFPPGLGEQLAGSHSLSAEKLAVLDRTFGNWMGNQVKELCQRENFEPIAVASHGHTVFHQPALKTSLQIGNGWDIHIASGLPVINDFRNLDIALGGQGAPLVPIGDRLLFPDMDFCLNLGGISNISMEVAGERLAFDISPFNLLLNKITGKMGIEYDKDGEMARSGKLLPALLQKLNEIPFYAQSGAKSLGRENLERDFYPLLDGHSAAENDVLHTLVQHYVQQISRIIKDFASGSPEKSLLVTGGGAFHVYFMELLEKSLQGIVRIHKASRELIEFKEAIVFAFLGVLKLRGENNCLASVTGASKDSCGGTAYGFGEKMPLLVSTSDFLNSH